MLPKTGDEPHLLKTDLDIDKLLHTSWPQREPMRAGGARPTLCRYFLTGISLQDKFVL